MLDFGGGGGGATVVQRKKAPSCVHLALSDPVVSGLEGSCVTSQGWALASSLADLDLQDMVKIRRWTAECGKIGLCALEFVEWGRFIRHSIVLKPLEIIHQAKASVKRAYTACFLFCSLSLSPCNRATKYLCVVLRTHGEHWIGCCTPERKHRSRNCIC